RPGGTGGSIKSTLSAHRAFVLDRGRGLLPRPQAPPEDPHSYESGTLTKPARGEKMQSLKLVDHEFQHRHARKIVGDSAALHQVEIVAPTDATVLLLGETGTGKELVAHAIHDASERSHRPFIKFSCAAIPSGLLESELFGHERGAFTGAIAQRNGRFELADGG